MKKKPTHHSKNQKTPPSNHNPQPEAIKSAQNQSS